MKRLNTYKAHAAMNLATEIMGNGRIAAPTTKQDVESLYALLADHDYVWKPATHSWEKRKIARPMTGEKTSQLASRIMLIRIMGTRDLLTEEMENFTLAMEVAGYEITNIDGPRANRGERFFRVYLRVKVG